MKKKFFLFILILTVGSNTISYAQGDLLIEPHRVVFEKNEVKKVITLLNTGDETATYTVSFVQRRMNEDGSFTAITEPDSLDRFADPFLRIYPRTVTLSGREGQTVMLQRRRNTKMEPGEYRSHLYFRAVPEEEIKPLENTEIENDEDAFSVNITPIYGISIPIIIRSGEVNALATLTDLKIPNFQEPEISFTLNREGNISVYGDFIVEYFPVKGEPFIVGRQNGVAIYTTINKRYISINLDKTSEMDLSKGLIKISYIGRAGANKKGDYYATESLLLER
jgi:hypothetical protein